PNATISSVMHIVKIRKLNRAIGETLKLLYNHRCQICGENISARYGVHIVETHQLEPFVVSFNNNADNQIIICPNHHRIIHKAKPVFDRKNLRFVYHNGIEENIVLNQHL
ncbi:MAG: HNH endonuclease, partial [Clostridiales bacterium]|nr:HNH endonuclease [Clostridiales bacterium]